MKISGQDPIRFLESYLLGVQGNQESASAKGSNRAPTASSDNIEISTKAKNFQHVNKLIASAPEVRSDRVEKAQAKIEKGSDHYQSAQVAEKLVRSTLLDTIL